MPRQVGTRDAFVAARRTEYEQDVDLERLAADLVLDEVVEAEDLRGGSCCAGCATRPGRPAFAASAATSRP